MVEIDREQFAKIITSAFKIYTKPVDEDILKLFWESLIDCTLQQVSHAMAVHLRKSPHPPRPADILKIINPSGYKDSNGTGPKAFCKFEDCQAECWGPRPWCYAHTLQIHEQEARRKGDIP